MPALAGTAVYMLPNLIGGVKAPIKQAAKTISNIGEKGVNLLKKYYGTHVEKLSNQLKEELLHRLNAGEKLNGQQIVELDKKLSATGKAQTEFSNQPAVQEKRVVARDAETSKHLDSLSSNPHLDEDVVDIIQHQGINNLGNLKAARRQQAINETRNPAFSTLEKREAAGDFIATNPKSKAAFQS